MQNVFPPWLGQPNLVLRLWFWFLLFLAIMVSLVTANNVLEGAELNSDEVFRHPAGFVWSTSMALWLVLSRWTTHSKVSFSASLGLLLVTATGYMFFAFELIQWNALSFGFFSACALVAGFYVQARRLLV